MFKLFGGIGAFNHTKKPDERPSPFPFDVGNKVLLRFFMHADPHETGVISFEKREVILQTLSYFIQRGQNGNAVNCLLELLYVDAIRPPIQRRLVESSPFA